jgi:hypothetical protein
MHLSTLLFPVHSVVLVITVSGSRSGKIYGVKLLTWVLGDRNALSASHTTVFEASIGTMDAPARLLSLFPGVLKIDMLLHVAKALQQWPGNSVGGEQ